MSRTAGIFLSILIGFSGAGMAMLINTFNPPHPFDPFFFGLCAFAGSMLGELTRRRRDS